eukprot:CAMPEP_0174261042 /NCGR_PEP_ID=MMETSP0439-20130205/11199_1 /TAXON_ID=0 /ORGANISM="Stereomyxa ramosa, Strain Chinc5" /LENGTH=360 /DNA_ID=CAMNT_0015345453 /DNA_START=29 /DNA_END=1108 /DNA_ORIENTATION=-
MSTVKENIQPQENVMAVQATGPVKPLAEPAPEQPKEEQTVVEEVEDEEESIDEEDSEWSEYEDNWDSDEDEELGEQSIWVQAPLDFEQESNDAIEMAKYFGLASTDDAVTKVGKGEKHYQATVSRYEELIHQDQQLFDMYEGITLRINSLRSSFNSGISQIVSELGLSAESGAIEACRTLMENFLRVVAERASIYRDYKEASTIEVQDVLTALQSLGRPLYWSKTIQQDEEDVVEDEAQPQEPQRMDTDGMEMEDADDEEYEISDYEDDEDMAWEEEAEGAEEEEEEVFHFKTEEFKELVDAVSHTEEGDYSQDSLKALQHSVEDYICQLAQNSGKATVFAGRSTISPYDVKFAHSMTIK